MHGRYPTVWFASPNYFTQVVLRGTDSVGPAFCALPRLEQLRQERQDIYLSFNDEVFGSVVAATYHLPVALLSGCTTGTPSQADVDCPEPQEVLVSKEPAYSFVDNVSLGLQLPPSGSGCLSPEGDSLQLAISVQSFVPCTGLAVS